MRKIFITLHTGYCGSTAHEVMEVEDTTTEKELNQMVWEMAVDNAASYGYDLCSDECEDAECEMEHPGSTNIEGFWVDYVPEKHDMKL